MGGTALLPTSTSRTWWGGNVRYAKTCKSVHAPAPAGPSRVWPKHRPARPRAHPAQGPSPARPGPEIGNLGTWKSRNLESQKISKMKVIKIQIHVAQNVSKVWIGRKKTKTSRPNVEPSRHFFHGPEKSKKNVRKSHTFLGGPTGPIQPV